MGSLLCSSCGTPNSEFNQRCTACGSELPLHTAASETPSGPDLQRGLKERPLLGRELSHYRVLREIGAGGMGRVYAAEDRNLGRTVALKVLPPPLAAHPERLERFRREARAVAALNHPNIVTLYSVEEAEGLHFLTMELVEGQTLDRLIPKGGVSPETFFELALPIVEALSAAHRSRILHRDLKPVNIMRSAEGVVKVLDFGLAKFEQEPAVAEVVRLISDAVTPVSATGGGDPLMETAESKPSLTTSGRVLGTIPYMSPEQLRGKRIDQRSDLFSLGVVLYELAVGHRPFQGFTAAEVMSAILRDTPVPPQRLRPELPEELGALIERLLAKEPEARFQSAGEVRDRLRSLERELQGIEAPAAARRRKRSLVLAAVMAVVVLPGLGLLGGRLGFLQGDPFVPLVPQRLDRLFPWASREAHAKISPDRQWISFISEREGEKDLWLTDVEGRAPRTVSASLKGKILFSQTAWSPDGRRIACLVGDGAGFRLRTVFVRDGSTEIDEALGAELPELARWLGNHIYLVVDDSLWEFDIGTKALVQRLDRPELRYLRGLDVRETPDGARTTVFSAMSEGRQDLWQSDLDGGGLQRLTEDDHLEQFPLWTGLEKPIIVYSSDRSGDFNLWQMRADTREVRQLTFGGMSESLDDVSPDGTLLTFYQKSESAHLFSLDLETGVETPLTVDDLGDYWPSVQRGSDRVAFQRKDVRSKAKRNLWGATRIASATWTEGGFEDVRTMASKGLWPALSPDGRWLAYLRPLEGSESRFQELWLRDLESTAERRVDQRYSIGRVTYFPLARLRRNMAWSPDSRFLYFVSEGQTHGASILRCFVADGSVAALEQAPDPGAQAQEEIWDLRVSSSGDRLGYVSRLVQEPDVFRVHLVDLARGTRSLLGQHRRESEVQRMLLLGFLDRDAMLAVRVVSGVTAWSIELLELAAGRSPAVLAADSAAVPATAVWNEETGTLYMSRMEGSVTNLFALDPRYPVWRRLTTNLFPGKEIGAVEFLSSKRLLYTREEKNSDIWKVTLGR